MRALFGVKGLGVLFRGQGRDQGSGTIKMAVGKRVSAEIWSLPWLYRPVQSWSEVLFRDFDFLEGPTGVRLCSGPAGRSPIASAWLI